MTREHMSMGAMAVSAVFLLSSEAGPAHAQAFTNVKNALVDYSQSDVEPRIACADLAKFKDKEIIRIETRLVPAVEDAPAHCRVSGVLAPEIGFEVNLPARWNRRFYMIGNGGHAGEGPDDPGRASQRASALQLGFVIATTNTGHDARKEPQASFVLSNPQKAIDYAYRAVHLTAATAKNIANEYYAKPVAHSYWNSCSNGGRQGLIEAQRYPQDFDGIVANAPLIEYGGYVVGALWNQRALTEASIPPEKLAVVAEAVMAKCDRMDGLADGLIDDPRRCDFDPARDVPTCAVGTDPNRCLTPAQASALKKVYGGAVSRGRPFFPGFMYGSEGMTAGPDGASTSGWVNLIVPRQPGAKPADQVVRTRPLCPYPQVARYKGEGSVDDAANFSCVAPAP